MPWTNNGGSFTSNDSTRDPAASSTSAKADPPRSGTGGGMEAMPTPLDLAYLTALAAASPWLAWRAARTGRYRRDLAAKLLGRVPSLPPPTAGRPRLWFHGVSVGEVHLLRQLVGRARAERPHWDCVVSASTDTGLDEARRCFSDLPTFAWPLDFSWAVRRALAAVRPDLLVLAEGELWPGMLAA